MGNTISHFFRKTGFFAAMIFWAVLWMPPFHSRAEEFAPTGGVAFIMESDLTKEEYIQCADAGEGAYWGYTNIGIAVTGGGELNVRKEPTTGSRVIGKMREFAACEVLESADGWAQIVSGDIEGFVSEDYLARGMDAIQIGRQRAVSEVVVLEKTGLKEEPSAMYEDVFTVEPGERLAYVGTMGNWFQVRTEEGEFFVCAEDAGREERLDTAISVSMFLYGKELSQLRDEIVEYAKQFVGNPYVYGGTSLTKGTDCSGFTMRVFEHFGFKLNRSAAAQSQNGREITYEELLPGDLLFYSKNGVINHVTMYIGGGKVVHASSPEVGITISSISYRTPVKFRRIIED